MDIAKSSLISKIEYDEDFNLLTVYFKKYYTDKLTFEGVYQNHFEAFIKAESPGKYFLHFIKPNFKQLKTPKMGDKPKTKNHASDKTRFIDISVDVTKILKEWLHDGEKGTYLNMTLIMRPDGSLDKNGNLGFLKQKVPTSVYKAAEAEKKGSGKDVEAPILGNACEIDWSAGGGGQEMTPGEDVGNLRGNNHDIVDDLPF